MNFITDHGFTLIAASFILPVAGIVMNWVVRAAKEMSPAIGSEVLLTVFITDITLLACLEDLEVALRGNWLDGKIGPALSPLLLVTLLAWLWFTLRVEPSLDRAFKKSRTPVVVKWPSLKIAACWFFVCMIVLTHVGAFLAKK